MNTFLEKLKELDKLNLPKKNYAITGSGPLAIRNIRNANDIDILVKKDTWENLKTKYTSYDENHIKIGNIEIWKDFINLTPIINEVIDSAEIIEKYPFVTLEHTISWKKFLNREKDLKDIKLIENFLKKKKKRFKTCVSSYLILKNENKVLLSLRGNTGYKDGYWGLVSGHVEKNESAKQAIIRESYEEAAITLDPKNLKFVTIMHRKSERENIDIFFETNKWKGKIINKEPHKIEKLKFFPINSMPSNLIDYIEKVFTEKKYYFELGWT